MRFMALVTPCTRSICGARELRHLDHVTRNVCKS
jgi:hypothetical protein